MSGGNLSGVYHFYTMGVTAATCLFVCPPYIKMRGRNAVAQTCACSKSVLGG